MLLTLAGGLAADRLPRGRILTGSLAVRAGVAILLATTLLTGTASFPLLLAAAGACGCADGFSAHAITAADPMTDELRRALETINGTPVLQAECDRISSGRRLTIEATIQLDKPRRSSEQLGVTVSCPTRGRRARLPSMVDLPRGKGLRIYRANAGFFAATAAVVACYFLVQAGATSRGRTAELIIGGVFAVLGVLMLIDMRRAKKPRTKSPRI